MKSRTERSLRLLPSRVLIATTALAATIASMGLVASRPTSLSIDGQRIASDVPPVVSRNRAYVPLRVVADGLGADTNYDAKSGAVELVRGSDTLRLRIGDRIATLNGNRMTLRHAPFTVRGRVMVSQETLSRAFGSKIRYDVVHAKVDVVTPGVLEAGAQQDSP